MNSYPRDWEPPWYDLAPLSPFGDTPYADAVFSVIQAEWLSTDELLTLIYRAGRVCGPKLLYQAYLQSNVDENTVASLAGEVWSMAEYPELELAHDEWRELFYEYTVDGVKVDRPTSNTLLYRGSVPDRRLGWSWTDDVSTARRFAGGVRGRPPGNVYQAQVEPKRLLARQTARDEAEYVVDTEGLAVVEVLTERA